MLNIAKVMDRVSVIIDGIDMFELDINLIYFNLPMPWKVIIGKTSAEMRWIKQIANSFIFTILGEKIKKIKKDSKK